jgi:hypothetical protein
MKAHTASHGRHDAHARAYRRLGVMALLSFATMYLLMYAMVDRWSNVYGSFNQVFMAGLMTAPMVVIELLLMRQMYPDGRLNLILVVVTLGAMSMCWFGIRQQVGVGDRQFVRSMIPHHAGAIQMCKNNHLADPDLQQLCARIIASQQAEIDQMRAKLRRD